MTRASIRAIIAIPALAAALFVPAARAEPAAEPEPYLVEYRAYNAALESGDTETAAAHGLAAWRAAEQALGDHRLTGILAYNYGRLVVFRATERATEPLRRASELQGAGLVELPQDTLRLYRTYAEFAASGFDEKAADDLREALDAVGMQEALIDEIAPMWLRLASEDFAAGEYRKATRSAAKAEAALPKANPEGWRQLAQALLIGAVANLVRSSRDLDDVEAANEQFGRARRLFPPQKDLDSFDPLLAQVIAWHHVSWDLLRALHEAKGRMPPGEEDDDSPPAPPYFQYQADGSLECDDFEWLERAAPDYPRGALRDGYLGAVALGYRLGEDLSVRDARVLAEVPVGERFGQESLEALSEWHPKSLPSGGSACSYVTVIRFVIDR